MTRCGSAGHQPIVGFVAERRCSGSSPISLAACSAGSPESSADGGLNLAQGMIIGPGGSGRTSSRSRGGHCAAHGTIVLGFVRRQLGLPMASTAPLASIGEGFSKAIRAFVREQGVPWIDFVRGQRKDEVMHQHLFMLTRAVLPGELSVLQAEFSLPQGSTSLSRDECFWSTSSGTTWMPDARTGSA